MIKQIKYSYCVDENGVLFCVRKLKNETRHSHQWYCLQCGQEMVPRLGETNAWHFAHKADTACDGESYLHKLAKKSIYERFVSADSFPISFFREVPCKESQKCTLYEKEICREEKEIPFDIKKWYDTCEEETGIGGFRPDLLLTCTTKKDRKPVFIEIFKTHQSEELKLSSEYRIIETKKIESEEDIEDIINRGFIEGVNCSTYNFSPKLPAISIGAFPISRFILYKSGLVKILKELTCSELNIQLGKNPVAELNLYSDYVPISGRYRLNQYKTGLVYLLKKGIEIKNCILCKFFKYSESCQRSICILHEELGHQSPFAEQAMAVQCPRFEIDPWFMEIPLSKFENYVSEVDTMKEEDTFARE